MATPFLSENEAQEAFPKGYCVSKGRPEDVSDPQ